MNKGHLLVLATAISSGFAVFYNATATKGIDPLAFTLVKNSLTALMLAGIVLLFGTWREFLKLNSRQWLSLLAIAVIGGSIPFALFFWGLSTAASAASASLIYRLLFIFASVLAIVFLKEKPSANTILGVGIILLANLLLVGKFGIGLGELAVLGATLLWSAENILIKRILPSVSPTAVAAARLTLGSLILFIAFGATGISTFNASLIGIGTAVSAAFLLIYVLTYYNGLSAIPVSEATALLSFGGIITAALQFAFAGKAPSPIEGASLLLIAAGVAVILWGGSAIASVASIFSKKRLFPWKA